MPNGWGAKSFRVFLLGPFGWELMGESPEAQARSSHAGLGKLSDMEVITKIIDDMI